MRSPNTCVLNEDFLTKLLAIKHSVFTESYYVRPALSQALGLSTTETSVLPGTAGGRRPGTKYLGKIREVRSLQKHQSGKGSQGTDMDSDGSAFPGRGDRKLLRQDNLGRG